MSILCMEYKACSIGYFLDEMRDYEVMPIMESLNYCVRNDWEMTREVMWSNLQAMSSKKLKPKDIMRFPWEDGGKVQSMKSANTQSYTNEEIIRRMRENEERTRAALLNAGII